MNYQYFYKQYGQNICSEMDLEEFGKQEENVTNYDIEISFKEIPLEIKEDLKKGMDRFIAKDEAWFFIDKIGFFHILGGKKINLFPLIDPAREEFKVYVYGSAMGFLLYQKNMIAVHGSAVLINGKSSIFIGEQGAGKSTLVSAFRKKGHKFLADDVSVVENIEKVASLYSGYPRQKLCPDAVEKFKNEKAQFNHHLEKFIVCGKENFYEGIVPIKAFFQLVIGEGSKVEIEEIKGKEKISLLLNNIYRMESLYDLGLTKVYFKKCIDIVEKTKFFRIKRPEGKFTVDEQIALIMEAVK